MWAMSQRYNNQIHIPQAEILVVLADQINQSAKVFLIPLTYSKVMQKGEISIAQLLTLEFMVF